MPANPKYLSSNWQRFAKISAGFLGGYFVSITFHMALSYWVNHVNVIITLTFTGFILWVTLMIIAFLAKNGWKIWGIYLFLSLFFSLVIYLSKTYHPIAL
ncbi:hypothetical protein QLS71_012425 [Mariniflexile litorale]|uniref:DUF3649 domain-containing protein n=1 Tax=Mariniflexile litorale TaxID=3045158 RepID=A0AAU7EDH0_9FLAO|nr:hypothetical protein [Mariniflexile sp. KMM 9835]MDQ8210424.1 hypothetical protein [Mariniflexile sp. KMM 9835]